MGSSLWPALAVGATLVFVVAIVTMHLLEPDLNSHSVSEYALGRYGWAIRIGFACLGIGLAALGAALRSALTASWVSTVGLVLLAVAGLGLIGIALFSTDPPGSKLTTAGFLHERFANLWSLSAALAMLVLGGRFVRTVPCGASVSGPGVSAA